MNTRASYVMVIVKLAAAVLVSVLLFSLVIAAMTGPVRGPASTYSAEFSDVSGLGLSGDIRTRGVRIGKVESIDLHRRGGSTVAEVRFTMVEPYRLTDSTILSVKYQNLTGARYIDADFAGGTGEQVEHVSTDNTRPSFDITDLFNGLQPVLATMSTDDINKFTENAITLLQGDGGGLQPMLDDAQRLAELAADREQVISTLATNLARISDNMGGRSPQVVEFLRSLSVPISAAMTVLDEFPKTAAYGPEFLRPVKRLLDMAGLHRGMDVESAVASAFSSVEEMAQSLSLLPSSVAGLQIPDSSGASSSSETCSNGVAKLPTDVQLLLNGSEVIVCSAQ